METNGLLSSHTIIVRLQAATVVVVVVVGAIGVRNQLLSADFRNENSSHSILLVTHTSPHNPNPHPRAMTDVAGSAQRHLAAGGGANPNPILFHIKRQINHL